MSLTTDLLAEETGRFYLAVKQPVKEWFLLTGNKVKEKQEMKSFGDNLLFDTVELLKTNKAL